MTAIPDGSTTERRLTDCEIFWHLHVPWLLEQGRDTTLPDLEGIAHFALRGDDADDWTVAVSEGQVTSVTRGVPADPTVSVALDTDEFLAIASGHVDHRESFFAGRIDVEGDVELMLWVAGLIPILRSRFPFQPSRYREGGDRHRNVDLETSGSERR